MKWPPVPRQSPAPSTVTFTFRRILITPVKLFISSLRILDRGSLKRETPNRTKNADIKKLRKSNTKIVNLSGRIMYLWGRKTEMEPSCLDIDIRDLNYTSRILLRQPLVKAC